MGVKGKSKPSQPLIVSDTGPILHLQESHLLHILHKAGRVVIPQKVNEELSHPDSFWRKNKPSWIQVTSLSPGESAHATSLFLSGLLDSGEAEAILLAKRVNSQWLLTDDVEARIFANSLGLEVHGSLGVLLWAAARGYLDKAAADQALDQLSRSSLWISKRILLEAQNALREIFS